MNWKALKSFVGTAWEGLRNFARAVWFHFLFAVMMPIGILATGFAISNTIARYVVLSGKEWQLEGMNYLLASVVLATCSIGIYLYYLRRCHRVLYGVVELVISVVLICVSLAMAWESILPSDTPNIAAKDFSVLKLVPWIVRLNIVLPIAAAIYVFVRGLDNIGEGLKKFPRMAAIWDDTFSTPEIRKQRRELIKEWWDEGRRPMD